MQGVLDLPGLSEPPRRKPPRLYFAVLPDGAAAEQLVGLTHRLLNGQGAGWQRMDGARLHLSLHPAAASHRFPAAKAYAAGLAARRVAASAFELCGREAVGLPPLHRRPDRCPLVVRTLDSMALDDLHRRLGAAMARQGLRPAPAFLPHVTLARGPRVMASQAIAPIRFAVRDFALVWSDAGYEVIDRFALRP